MIRLNFEYEQDKGLTLLFVGAHCDDIEIGCGGTILRLIEEHKIHRVKWVVFASSPARKKEALASANIFLAGVEDKDVVVYDYRDAFLNQFWSDIKEKFEDIKTSIQPDVIFTHHQDDKHQDHRLISELTWNTFRDHFIMEYEIPKYDGDLAQPNFYFQLSDAVAKRKAKLIVDSFKSQANRHWFEEEVFLSLMRIRGLESAGNGKYSEAFYVNKAVY